ncbi:MAG: TlyA family RNA methyltransferase [Hyphomicrobiales bacterium]|nr:TlyA family RNA methyltransferase [Hyphomicrobiales bacterium]
MNARAARADVALVERGFFPSRAKAREAIEAGLVRVAGRIVVKPSEPIAPEASIDARAPYEWVSRGGVKLAAALDAFALDPRDKRCLDIGASTGGFTHVLLTAGAQRVLAVDVGHGQLHERIAGDPRVVSLEQTDARKLTADAVAASLRGAPQFIVVDVSFIPLRLVLPHVLALAAPEAELVALVKPQFEAGREHVRKGVVRDEKIHAAVLADAAEAVARCGWSLIGDMPSPIEGGDGNREFLIAARR